MRGLKAIGVILEGGGVLKSSDTFVSHCRAVIKFGLPRWCNGKESACQCTRMVETWVQTLGQEDPLEEGMATYSSILAWRISWTEEPERLQFIGSQSWK